MTNIPRIHEHPTSDFFGGKPGVNRVIVAKFFCAWCREFKLIYRDEDVKFFLGVPCPRCDTHMDRQKLAAGDR